MGCKSSLCFIALEGDLVQEAFAVAFGNCWR